VSVPSYELLRVIMTSLWGQTLFYRNYGILQGKKHWCLVIGEL